MSAQFNFEIDECVTPEKIIRATLLNPLRRNKQEIDRVESVKSHGGWGYKLWCSPFDLEKFLRQLRGMLKTQLEKLLADDIRLYDTSRLGPKIDRSEWIADLKSMTWHGPFFHSVEVFSFHTVTDEGEPKGLMLLVDFVEARLGLFYVYEGSARFAKNYEYGRVLTQKITSSENDPIPVEAHATTLSASKQEISRKMDSLL